MSGAAIEAEGLTLYYGDRAAVNQVTLSVGRGEIFGFLGPNGAGKSTTTRMLTGFLAPSEGSVRLAGIDVARDPTTARELIGIVPEEANVYTDLTVWQNVMLMAELHRVGRRRRTERGTELLGLFGLDDRRRQKGRELSKGLRQRLMLCGALVSDPDILFLDEPTSGLDVASAHMIRDIVVRLNRQRAMTVFITTHNIEEAGDLCHRVGIIDRGRLVAIDTPQHLRSTVESRRSVVCASKARRSRPATYWTDLRSRKSFRWPMASASTRRNQDHWLRRLLREHRQKGCVSPRSAPRHPALRTCSCTSRPAGRRRARRLLMSAVDRTWARIIRQAHAAYVIAKKDAIIYYLKTCSYTAVCVRISGSA